MNFTFYIYHYNKKLSKEIKDALKLILTKLNNMATKEEFDAALADITSALENIAGDITRLTDQLQTGNLTPAQEQEVFNQLRAVADRARNIADQTPE